MNISETFAKIFGADPGTCRDCLLHIPDRYSAGYCRIMEGSCSYFGRRGDCPHLAWLEKKEGG